MKNKHITMRFLIGFSCGVIQGALVCFIFSLAANGINGDYVPALPKTVELFGSENLAVVIQTLLTGLLGVAYAMAALVYENPKWSFAKQSILQFLMTFPCIMVVAVICWFPQNTGNYISIAASILTGYVINFIVQFNIAKNDVRAINSKMEEYVKSLEDNNDSN